MNKRVPQLQILKKRVGNKGLMCLNELDFIVKDTLVARFHYVSILLKEINFYELLTSIGLQFVLLSLPQSAPLRLTPHSGGCTVLPYI